MITPPSIFADIRLAIVDAGDRSQEGARLEKQEREKRTSWLSDPSKPPESKYFTTMFLEKTLYSETKAFPKPEVER